MRPRREGLCEGSYVDPVLEMEFVHESVTRALGNSVSTSTFMQIPTQCIIMESKCRSRKTSRTSPISRGPVVNPARRCMVCQSSMCLVRRSGWLRVGIIVCFINNNYGMESKREISSLLRNVKVSCIVLLTTYCTVMSPVPLSLVMHCLQLSIELATTVP